MFSRRNVSSKRVLCVNTVFYCDSIRNTRYRISLKTRRIRQNNDYMVDRFLRFYIAERLIVLIIR